MRDEKLRQEIENAVAGPADGKSLEEAIYEVVVQDMIKSGVTIQTPDISEDTSPLVVDKIKVIMESAMSVTMDLPEDVEPEDTEGSDTEAETT